MLLKLKRWTALLLTAVMLLGALPMQAQATYMVASNLLATPAYHIDDGYSVGDLSSESNNNHMAAQLMWFSTEGGTVYVYFAIAGSSQHDESFISIGGVDYPLVSHVGGTKQHPVTIPITIGGQEYYPHLPQSSHVPKWYIAKVPYSALQQYGGTFAIAGQGGGLTITATLSMSYNVTVTVNKQWQGGTPTQPAIFHIVRTLPPSTAALESYRLEVHPSGSGSASISGLPLYEAGTMKTYAYSVREIDPGAGYRVIAQDAEPAHTTAYDATSNKVYHTFAWNVVNGKTPTINISARKKWAGVPVGAQLPAVKLQLVRRVGEGPAAFVAEATPDAEGYVRWDNQYALDPMGRPYLYGLAEDPVPANYVFTSEYEGELEGVRSFTGTNTWQTRDFTFTKTWVDGMGGFFPRNASFVLRQDGVDYATITWNDMQGEGASRSHTFTGLPVYKATDAPYTYSIKELAVPGYTTAYSTGADGHPLMTNTLDAGKTITVTANKLWVENPNYPPAPNKKATLVLLADGVYLPGSAIELDGVQDTGMGHREDSPWHAMWPNLPEYRLDGSGARIAYTVMETWAPPGYSRAITSNGAGDPNFTATNTNRGAVFNLTKAWDGDPPPAGASLQFQLYRGVAGTAQNPATDTKIGAPITMNGSEGWRYTWDGLLAASMDTPPVSYQYYARELSAPLPGYYDAISSASARISNFQMLMDFTATKKWDGGLENQRPGVTLTLKRYVHAGPIPNPPSPGDTVETIGSKTLPDADGQWTATWTGLNRLTEAPKDRQQPSRWIYFVEETLDPGSPYVALYPADKATTNYNADNTWAEVTNTYVSPMIAVTTNKTWVGGPSAGQEAQLRLRQNGENYGDPVMTENLSYTWQVPKTDHNGKDYTYSVVELGAPYYYGLDYAPASVSGESGSIAVTNTYKAEAITVPASVTKHYTGRLFYPEGMQERFDFLLTGPKLPELGVTGSITFDGMDTVTSKRSNLVDAMTFGLDDLKNPDGTYATSRVFEYTMRELVPEEPAAWINYDADPHTIRITLTDNQNGTLSLDIKGNEPFSNSYKVTPATLTLQDQVTKVLANLPLSAFPEGGLPFTFHVAGDGYGEDGVDVTVHMSANGQQQISLPSLQFTQRDLVGHDNPRLLTYTVTETAPPEAEKLPGLNYDGQSYTLYYELEDDGYGKLSLRPVDSDRNPLEDAPDIIFTNTYRTKDAEPLTLKGTKQLSGRTGALSDDHTFTFTLAGDGKLPELSTDSLTFTANGSQPFAFGPIAYTYEDLRNEDGSYASSREFSYIVSEAFDIPGVSQQAGGNATYKVLVKDNGDGSLSATVTSAPVVISNAYRADDAEPVTLGGNKELKGRTGTFSDTFHFDLTGGKLPAAGSSASLTFAENGTQNFSFGPITYTFDDLKNPDGGYAPYKDFTYTISERPYSIAGVSPQGATSTTVTVRVADDGQGKLTTSITGGPAAFTNAYKASGLWIPKASKLLRPIERKLKDKEFQFLLSGVDVDVPGTAYNDLGGSVIFDAVHYTVADAGKTYTYTIKEIAGSETGMHYDDMVLTVEVTIADNGDGTLSVEPAYPDDTVFNNSYTAAGKWIPQVSKDLKGRVLEEGAFSFELVDGGGNVLLTATNAVDGSVVFDAIPYDQSAIGKNYSYIIREVKPLGTDPAYDAGMHYDPLEVKVNVRVSDQGNGVLVATPTYPNDKEFNNIYTAEDSWTPKAWKDLRAGGRGLKAGEFQFELYEGDEWRQTRPNAVGGEIIFDAITYTQADIGATKTYTMREVVPGESDAGYEANMAYATDPVTVTVTIGDAGGGKLQIEPVYSPADAAFINTYKASGSYDVNEEMAIRKQLTAGGRKLAEGEFSFVISRFSADDNAYVTKETVTNDADGKVSFARLTFDENDIGREYSYQVAEVMPDPVENGMTYAGEVLAFILKVTDQGGGQLKVERIALSGSTTFTNTYKASGTFSVVDNIAVKKLLEAGGRALKANEFSFALSKLDPDTGAYADIETVGNALDGTVPFSALAYTQDDIGNTYTYRVREATPDPAEEGMAYSDNVLTFTVKVEDATNGALSLSHELVEGSAAFTNRYTATGSYDINQGIGIRKHLDAGGRKLAEGEFSFTLSQQGEDGLYHAVGAPVTNAADGSLSFPELTFDQSDIGKEYSYQVVETAPAIGDAGYDAGMTYADNVLAFKLKVLDLTGGVLSVVRTALTGDTTFTNTYKASGAWLPVMTKELDAGGRKLKENEFSFTLRKLNPAKQLYDIVQSGVGNAEDGSIPFTALAYTQADIGETYTYTITESPGSEAGMSYDTAPKAVTVAISDNTGGQLTVTPTYPDDTVFNNSYTATGYFTAQVGKHLDAGGRGLKGDEFQFQLTDGQGKLLEASNASPNALTGIGSVIFPAITYTQADIGKRFTYTISEVAGSEPGMVYDPMKVEVTVDITNGAGNGVLGVVPSYPDDTVFNNSYTAAGVWIPKVSKQLSAGGRLLGEGEFTFVLKDSDRVQLQTANNGAPDLDTGIANAVFQGIPYTHQDIGKTYTYYITELPSTESGMTHDLMEVKVEVSVTNGDGNGALGISATYSHDTEFNNSYTAKGAWLPQFTKHLSAGGRALADDAFTFVLSRLNPITGQQTPVQRVKNKADGTIPFIAIPYTQDDIGQSYRYTISELVLNPLDPGYEAGMTYDPMKVEVDVTISNGAGGGVLGIAVSEIANSAFNNTYQATGLFIPRASKKLNAGGRVLADGEFSFQLSQLNPESGEYEQVQTVTNVDSGLVEFSAIPYTQDDIGKSYEYRITEAAGTEAGMLYDPLMIDVKAVISNGEGGGKLGVQLFYPLNTQFTNTYTATGAFDINQYMGVTKLLKAEGRALKADEFTFVLSQLDGETGSYQPLQSATNLADGKVLFEALAYTQEDIGNTYSYQIAEMRPSVPESGMTYSDNLLAFTVTVADDGDGKLAVQQKITGGTTVFINELILIPPAPTPAATPAPTAQPGPTPAPTQKPQAVALPQPTVQIFEPASRLTNNLAECIE